MVGVPSSRRVGSQDTLAVLPLESGGSGAGAVVGVPSSQRVGSQDTMAILPLESGGSVAGGWVGRVTYLQGQGGCGFRICMGWVRMAQGRIETGAGIGIGARVGMGQGR